MNIIKYAKLYNYISSEEKLSGKARLRTILRIRKLPKEFKDCIAEIIDGLIPNISVMDITLEQLMDRDGMQPIKAILYLDWLRREPANAIHHMANDTILSTKQLLNDEQEKDLDSNIERLRKMVDDRKRKQIEKLYDINEINDQSDIIY